MVTPRQWDEGAVGIKGKRGTLGSQKRKWQSSRVIPSCLSPGVGGRGVGGREESEPAARWKEQGAEGRGGGGYVPVGPALCLVTAPGGRDPEAWPHTAVDVGRTGAQVWPWVSAPKASSLKGSSPNDRFL